MLHTPFSCSGEQNHDMDMLNEADMSHLGLDFPQGFSLPPDRPLPPSTQLDLDRQLPARSSQARVRPLLRVQSTSSGERSPSVDEYSPSNGSIDYFHGHDSSSSSDERRSHYHANLPRHRFFRGRRPSSLGPNGGHSLPNPPAEVSRAAAPLITPETSPQLVDYLKNLEEECQWWKMAYVHVKYIHSILFIIE